MTQQHRHSLASAAVGIAGCLLLTACGDSNPAATAATPPAQITAGDNTSGLTPTATAGSVTPVATAATTGVNACGLITQDEVAAALGTDPGPGKPFTSHASSQCQFGTYQTTFVLVNLTPSHGRAAYDVIHNAKGGPKVDLAANGLGDKAYEVTRPGTDSIFFAKADALVLVMISIHGTTSPAKGRALALARTAAKRL